MKSLVTSERDYMDMLKLKVDGLSAMINVFSAGKRKMEFDAYIYSMDRIMEYVMEYFEGCDIWEAIDKKYLPSTSIKSYDELVNWNFKLYEFQHYTTEEKEEKRNYFDTLLIDLICFDGEE